MGRVSYNGRMGYNIDPLPQVRAEDLSQTVEDVERAWQDDAKVAERAAHQEIGRARAQENPNAMARAHSPSKAPKRPIGVHLKAISVLAAKIFGGLCGAFAVGLAVLGAFQGNTWLWTQAPLWIALPISGAEFSVVTAAFVHFIKKW